MSARRALSAYQVRLLRQRAQGLVPTAGRSPDAAAVARSLCGIQAQYEAAAALTIRARTSALVAADVARARGESRMVFHGFLYPMLLSVFMRRST